MGVQELSCIQTQSLVNYLKQAKYHTNMASNHPACDKFREGEKKSDISEGDYKALLTRLPKEKGWMEEHLYQYEGFWYNPIVLLPGIIRAQQNFKAKPSDVFVVSPPKAGNTWLKALVFAIMNRNKENFSKLLTSNPHVCVPFLELFQLDDPVYADDIIFGDQKPGRLLGTHIPVTSLPGSILASGCKIVYICRDPKDVLISLWQFAPKVRTEDSPPPFTLEEAHEMFCKGVSHFSPYWDHVLGYWKLSLEQPQRVLFLKYEDLLKEPLVYVNKLAEFLDCPFTTQDKVQANDIVDLCSFESLSKLNKKNDEFQGKGVVVKSDAFFRQGKVGDWRNHLTLKMADQIDQITRSKLDGSGLSLV